MSCYYIFGMFLGKGCGVKAVEEETGQPFSFIGRWRGRRLWILMCAGLLAAAAVFVLVWFKPVSDDGTGQASPVQHEMAQPEPASGTVGDTANVQTQEAAEPQGSQQPTTTPRTQGSAPGTVVEFPEPVTSEPETPPPGGYTDICGHWVLDMSGPAYGLTNCHIVLNEDGTISSPPEYDQVFRISASTYSWQEGDTAFSASLQLVLKMGSGQVQVPVQVELAGNVDESMLEIMGNFTASPQGEAYAPYFQQGGFTMQR
jgi:hypothetical protein